MSDAVTVLRAPSRHTLEQIAHVIVGPLEAAGAERAVAFGSYARGDADGYSDLDLAVVLHTGRPATERWRLLTGVLDQLRIPVDLLVYTPEEFSRGMHRGFGVFAAIAQEGVTLYERSSR
jgi:predicted nucleotidyltransferase